MNQLSRVVWSEGMYLGPHDFQTQSAWLESSVDFATRALWFEPYGFLGCELNREALANGTVSLTHARGIFPDGLPFHMRECDPLPEPRYLADQFPPTRDSMMVYLAVPAYRPGQQNTSLNGSSTSDLRFVAEEKTFVDENTGLDQKAVQLGRKNIRILLENELGEQSVRLPLARIRRNREGLFVSDENFIPPCLRINASVRLLALTERLVEVLSHKLETLVKTRPERIGFSARLSAQQVAGFWLRHALSSAIPILRHLCFSHQGHPEELFREMSRLAGALCTFGINSNPVQLPLYDHQNLESCFDALDTHIRAHLELLAPTNCVLIPLQHTSDYFHNGNVADTRCLGHARWFLAVRANVDEAALIRLVPKVVKVCSARFVPDLVRRAVPGMRLTHVPTPPASVSPRLDTQYFSLTLEGPCWDHIVSTKQVGCYVPGEISNSDVGVVVLLEN